MSNTTIALRDFAGEIEITDDAKQRKLDLITAGQQVQRVTDEDENSTALAAFRDLKALRVEVEAQRKAIKAPVLALGKKIDEVAATFIADAEREERRIEGHINHYQALLARERAEQERKAESERRRIAEEAAAAQRAQEAAERARQQAELAAQQAEALRGKKKAEAEAAAAKLAEEARIAEERALEQSLAAEMAPEIATIEIEKTKGVSVKEVLDYQVNGRNEFEQHASLVRFAAAYPRLVRIEIKRRDLLDELAAGRITEAPGITITSNLKTTIR